MSKTLTCLFLLLSPLLSLSQAVTPEMFQEYVKPHKENIQKAGEAYHKFADATHGSSVEALRYALKDFQTAAGKVLSETNEAQPLNGETLYLAEVKKLGQTFINLGNDEMASVLMLWTAGNKQTELNDLHHDITVTLRQAGEKIYWAEQMLIADLFYTKQAEAYCHSSNLLMEEALTGFKKLNAGPSAKPGIFNVTSLAAGALEGSIETLTGDTVAKFLMFSNPDKEVAYKAFMDMICIVLACKHPKMGIVTGMKALDEVRDYTPAYFVYSGKNGNPGKITITMQANMDRPAGKTWEVIVEYQKRRL